MCIRDRGVDAAVDYVHSLAEGLQKYMLLLGCLTPKELRDVPLIVTGETRDFIASRGYELAKLCRWLSLIHISSSPLRARRRKQTRVSSWWRCWWNIVASSVLLLLWQI